MADQYANAKKHKPTANAEAVVVGPDSCSSPLQKREYQIRATSAYDPVPMFALST